MRLIVSLISIFMFTALAEAQNLREAAQNTAQIQQGRENLARDIRELEEPSHSNSCLIRAIASGVGLGSPAIFHALSGSRNCS